jgi:hypothetical protein
VLVVTVAVVVALWVVVGPVTVLLVVTVVVFVVRVAVGLDLSVVVCAAAVAVSLEFLDEVVDRELTVAVAVRVAVPLSDADTPLATLFAAPEPHPAARTAQPARRAVRAVRATSIR